MSKWIKILSLLAGVFLIGGSSAYFFICPCAVIPGGSLEGEVVNEPVSDWSFANNSEAVPLCQIEVDFAIARSMNVYCFSSNNALFVSCAQCEGKQWARRVASNPDGFVRAAGRVYPISYSRVTDEDQLDRLWEARRIKIDGENIPRPSHWWSFNLTSR